MTPGAAWQRRESRTVVDTSERSLQQPSDRGRPTYCAGTSLALTNLLPLVIPIALGVGILVGRSRVKKGADINLASVDG